MTRPLNEPEVAYLREVMSDVHNREELKRIKQEAWDRQLSIGLIILFVAFASFCLGLLL